MWVGTDRSSSLDLGLGRKVRFEERAFQKGSTWEQNLKAGFLAGNGSSQWHEHLPMMLQCGQQ